MTDHVFRFYDALGTEQFLMEYLDSDNWNALLACAELVTFAAGETLVQAEDTTRVMYIAVEGTFDVQVQEGADKKRIDTMTAPTVFGEQTFLDGRPRSADIAAHDAGQCYRLTMDGLRNLVRDRPGLASVFLFDLARIMSLRFRAWQ